MQCVEESPRQFVSVCSRGRFSSVAVILTISAEMFGRSLMRASVLRQNVPQRSTSGVSKPVAESVAKSSSNPSSRTVDSENILGSKKQKCSNFDKWLLVWMKKYPSKDQIPEKVSLDMLQRVQSQARVRVANIMIVGTLIGCVWAVVSGKKEAKEGKSLAQQNQEWHEKINREYRESLAANSKTT